MIGLKQRPTAFEESGYFFSIILEGIIQVEKRKFLTKKYVSELSAHKKIVGNRKK